jgi:hypothetical protein
MGGIVDLLLAGEQSYPFFSSSVSNFMLSPPFTYRLVSPEDPWLQLPADWKAEGESSQAKERSVP